MTENSDTDAKSTSVQYLRTEWRRRRATVFNQNDVKMDLNVEIMIYFPFRDQARCKVRYSIFVILIMESNAKMGEGNGYVFRGGGL